MTRRKSSVPMFDNRPTIMIVDDDEVAVMAVRRAIKRHGLPNPTVEARDGLEALERLRAGIRRPYLILLDINMPRMTGLELLATIRADDELTDSVVFIMTTSDSPRDVSEAYRLHAAGYIRKEEAYRSISEAVSMLDVYFGLVTLPTETGVAR